MAAYPGAAEDSSGTPIPQELQLQHQSISLHKTQPSRRAASLALPCLSTAAPAADDGPRLAGEASPSDRRSRSYRHLSLSPWRMRRRSPHDPDGGDIDGGGGRHGTLFKSRRWMEAETGEKRGIWSWKPMRTLAHIAMHRLVCLLSVEVVAIRRLPASMNGLRLSVAVRKKETKDGAARTMPSRVMEGSAEFEETLFIRSHLYCSGGAGTGKPLKFEPRPFLISTAAVDAPLLDLGSSVVDLSSLVKESIRKNLEGQRVRQWDMAFLLSGKAKGGELVLKLAFQIMEDGGIGIYNHTEAIRSKKEKDSNFSASRKQPKSSLSVANPIMMIEDPSATSSNGSHVTNSEKTIDFSLDSPGLSPSISLAVQIAKQDLEEEDFDLPEFEVIDKGIEIQEGNLRKEEQEVTSEEDATEGTLPVSSEVVKEVVHDRAQRIRPKELHLIAGEVKALDLTMMMEEDATDPVKSTQEHKVQILDTEEETVTREFLQLLDLEESKESECDAMDIVTSSSLGVKGDDRDEENNVLTDLGKSLGSIIQTRDGGYLASMNPFNGQVARKETPKLAMQISRELILDEDKIASGCEVFQRLAAMGLEEMGSKLLSLTAMDELIGKTAEQIAFEGIASAIISGRNKEGASSSAARSITVVKKMAAALSKGIKERILTGIWSVNQEPVTADEILTFSLQKMEGMAIEALRIQADMTEEEEEALFDVSPEDDDSSCNPLDSAISIVDWSKTCSPNSEVTVLVVIQLRDPLRRYESVGAPLIAVAQAVALDDAQVDDEKRFKLTSLHVGGLKLSSNTRSMWDGEKQRLTAMQWLVENGMGKAGRRTKQMQAKGAHIDVVWSISSRVTEGIWLKPARNPNVKVCVI